MDSRKKQNDDRQKTTMNSRKTQNDDRQNKQQWAVARHRTMTDKKKQQCKYIKL